MHVFYKSPSIQGHMDVFVSLVITQLALFRVHSIHNA